jgi:hypothetical protein
VWPLDWSRPLGVYAGGSSGGGAGGRGATGGKEEAATMVNIQLKNLTPRVTPFPPGLVLAYSYNKKSDMGSGRMEFEEAGAA